MTEEKIGAGKFTVELSKSFVHKAVIIHQCRWESLQLGLRYNETLPYNENAVRLGLDSVCVKLEDVDALIVKLLAIREQMEG